MTTWLVANPRSVKGGRIEHSIIERPLLHCCCALDHFGDVTLDLRAEVKPKVIGDVTALPFADDSFAAAFADFPWVGAWRWTSAKAIREMLRVAPVVYTLSPWLYGARICRPDVIYISWRPGINHPILFVRYIRK